MSTYKYGKMKITIKVSQIKKAIRAAAPPKPQLFEVGSIDLKYIWAVEAKDIANRMARLKKLGYKVRNITVTRIEN